MSFRRSIGIGLVAVAFAGSAAAAPGCVGSEPQVNASPDASGSDATSADTGAGDAGAGADSTAQDAGDAAPVLCDVTKPFGAPVQLTEFESLDVEGVHLSADELSIYMGARSGSSGNRTLMYAQRASNGDPFGAPSELSMPDNDGTYDNKCPTLTPDLLTMVFDSNMNEVEYDFFSATRASVDAPFGAPQLLSISAPGNYDFHPDFVADGSELWFSSGRNGVTFDLFRVTFAGGSFGTPAAVAELNTPTADHENPVLSSDKLAIYFASDGPFVDGGAKDFDIFVATRSSPAVTFGTPSPVSELNSSGTDRPQWISADNCRIYIYRDVGALYVATRSP